MKTVIALLITLVSFKVYGWEAIEKWKEDLTQELVINCDQGEIICQNTCGNINRCEIQTSYCKDCVGSGIFLSYFYQNVGAWFINSGIELAAKDLSQYLVEENYILLSYNSPYNIFGSINDMRMERAFNSLCPDYLDPYPVVIGKLNNSHELVSVETVICHGDEGARAFSISSLPQVDINHPIMIQLY